MSAPDTPAQTTALRRIGQFLLRERIWWMAPIVVVLVVLVLLALLSDDQTVLPFVYATY